MIRSRRALTTVAVTLCLAGWHLEGRLSAERLTTGRPSSPSAAGAPSGTAAASLDTVIVDFRPLARQGPPAALFGILQQGFTTAGADADRHAAGAGTLQLRDAVLPGAALIQPEFFSRRDGYRRSRGHHHGAAAAIAVGAAAAIAGTAVLVYANRPECSTNPAAGGCGYGTKVVGGAVLAGGVVGLAVGAASW